MRPPRLSLIALAVVAVCWLGPATPGVRAASLTTDCAGLQAALDQAQTGDTITLNQLCIGSTFSLSQGSNDSRSYTLTGAPGSGAGFDGTGAGGHMLSASNTAGTTPTATLTLNNLVLKNGNAASAAGGAVSFDGDYSISLSGDTFSANQSGGGNDGGAVALHTAATSAQVTLNNDTFTGNSVADGLGGAVSVIAAVGGSTSGSTRVAMSNDTFTGNQTTGSGQGDGGAVELLLPVATGSVTVTNSTFRNNATQTSGGGLDVFSPFVPIPVTLTGNTFAGNTVSGCGCGSIQGGGVAIFSASPGTGTAPITQTGNAFSGNRITGGSGTLAGGGEAIGGDTLNSTGDIFTGNTLPAPSGGSDAEGAGLSIQTDCSTSTPQHQATNLVLAGNSIGDGGAGSAEGALSTSCGTGSGQPTSLNLINSTISGNSGGGGTAGINGESIDQLTLQNTILTGNSDGGDLGGFGSSSVAASYTDLCSGGSPFAGTGNICAPPALANPPAGDVHETSSSPTIDVGSNVLVPSGVSSDAYGAARIQPRVAGNPPIVDMGAAEFPAIPLAPSASIGVPAAGGTYAQGQAVSSSFTCTEGTGGPGISSCLDQAGHSSGSAIDTAKPGPHTFTVTATSSDGKTGTKSVSYTVAGAPTVTIANPGPGAVYTLHNVVRSSFSCAEGPSGPGIKSCTDQDGNGSGRPLDTSSNGVHQLTVTASSADGQTTTRTVSYRVRLPSNHLLAPIRFKARRDGTFIVNVKVPGPGVVHVLVTAWENNIAGIARVLNPAPKRFVFGRGIARPKHKGWTRIAVRPNPFGRQLVANPRYRITLRLWISYIPTHGNQRNFSFYGLHLPTVHG